MIEELKSNEIFVFGSNLNGNHAGGAARTAAEKFGAEEGIGYGPTGQCYAFPTLGYQMEKLPLNFLRESSNELKRYARQNSHLTFFLTPVGLGIAGYPREVIEACFEELPENIVKTSSWSEYD